MPTKYSKLVRDKIPEIMRAEGLEPVTRVLDEGEYKRLLRAKLLDRRFGLPVIRRGRHRPE